MYHDIFNIILNTLQTFLGVPETLHISNYFLTACQELAAIRVLLIIFCKNAKQL